MKTYHKIIIVSFLCLAGIDISFIILNMNVGFQDRTEDDFMLIQGRCFSKSFNYWLRKKHEYPGLAQMMNRKIVEKHLESLGYTNHANKYGFPAIKDHDFYKNEGNKTALTARIASYINSSNENNIILVRYRPLDGEMRLIDYKEIILTDEKYFQLYFSELSFLFPGLSDDTPTKNLIRWEMTSKREEEFENYEQK